MREHFDEELAEIKDDLVELCALTEVAIDRATRALLDTDLTAADRAAELNADIDTRGRELDHRALTLIARQQPVALDLRALIGGMHNIADLRRMGSLAAHIAEVARLHHPEPVVPFELRAIISDMGVAAAAQAAAAREVLRTRDEAAALDLIWADERTDELLRRLFAATKGDDWLYGAASAVNITLLGRFYERFCDHTVEISRRVIFVITGEFPDE
ncbi:MULTISPECIES: phosphate signaling complex protein PhoU [Rhodococcus]|uniref:Phosphate-specific transport system accessory protein PhoU n=2 Tax=Rhodococcus opacus TaxID=37919 RepID=K8XPH2_RHOOP|nr:phosphate signaling complex protein PhoU [Rhodococcus opacus]ELB90571.1 putative phosphate transport system regulatory protein [Rhodococcus wratislaviensis IFP 2016]NHU46988.1 phosphate signaling complex protein PhoU [Rhodococcus sp. A14]ANS31433.1 putative phosphate transport system regulatory protein [Rhodococcus opacus]EKT83359.1 putative phosphate transport system regulatory protein [Rhodococcus opacus M213]MBA8961362.1 phosphate transport system protein [Rhodococcus opacus]